MQYVPLGRSGLKVSELCLGTMTFGEEFGFGADREECRRVFDTYLDAGGNFIDTANIYNAGTSERFLGEFVREGRGRLVLATKYSFSSDPTDATAGGNSRKNMAQSLEASLRRLGTDYIDLYWVHIWDGMTPVDEIMRGLDDLVRAGKILYIGVSNTPAWCVARANTLAELRGWSAFAAMQVHYNLIERAVERELLPMAADLGIGTTAWSPLAGGVLTGKYLPDADAVQRGQGRLTTAKFGAWGLNERNAAIAGTVVGIARDIGAAPAQVAIAWLRQQPRQVVPIIGARLALQLSELLGAVALRLSPEVMQRLDEATKIPLGYPHDMLHLSGVRTMMYGAMIDRLDLTRR